MVATTMVRMGDIFEECLGDINYQSDEDDVCYYPFKCRVGVVKYRPPRHHFFEYIFQMGKPFIEPILYHEKFNMPEVLTFVFPERFMSVHEERSFTYELARHPQVGELKQLDIFTKSPMLVGSFRAEMIRVLTWPDDDCNYIPLIKEGG